MAEVELENLDEDLEIETSNEDLENEPTGDEETEISREQAQEWKRQASRTAKAEAKLVELKKQLKNKEKTETPINSKDEVKKIMAEEKFYDKNPEAESYRKQIEEYQKKGLSLDESYLLASKQDRKIEENREVYGKGIVKGNVTTESLSAISIDDFDRMTPQAQEDYTKKMTSKYGKIKFK